LSVVGAPSSVEATKPVTTTIGAATLQSALRRCACDGAANQSTTLSAVTSHIGSVPTVLVDPLSPRPPPALCSTISTSRASSHADGTSCVRRYACIVIADQISP